jgi:puromycin-sensitive aminopeptidase
LYSVHVDAIENDSNIYTTHPVRLPVPHPDDLDDIFDSITYNKGSALCRMIFEYIGDYKIYQECLRTYMRRFAYKNAKSEDLLKVMSEISGKDLIEVFTPWIT